MARITTINGNAGPSGINGTMLSGFVMTQGAQFGDSVFEGMLLRGGGIPFYSEHLERIHRNAKALDIPLPSEIVLREWVSRTAKTFGRRDALIRMYAFRGEAGWGISCNAKDSVITITMDDGSLRATVEEGAALRVGVVQGYRKPPCDSLDMRIKAGANYFSLKKGLNEATSRGWQDGILLSHDGFVSEAVVENVFWLEDAVLFTPSVEPATNCLPGITRAAVIKIARALNVQVIEGVFPERALRSAGSLILTGTSAGVVRAELVNAERAPQSDEIALIELIAARYKEMCSGSDCSVGLTESK